jgi:CO dehydrogenase/acetyl-CoA synthase alpha subunit
MIPWDLRIITGIFDDTPIIAANDSERIDKLVANLKNSSYVSSTTRCRINDIIRQEVESHNRYPTQFASAALAHFDSILSTAHYIPRAVVRNIIDFVNAVKQNQVN